VTERKQNLLALAFALVKEVLFRIAFAACIVVQVVLWALLVGGLSMFLPSDNYFVLGTLLSLIFAGPVLIGAANYFLFERIGRKGYILAESEKWLAERQQKNTRQTTRRKLFKRWAVWIPTAAVVIVSTFLDEALALASHILHPGPSRVIGYRVAIPLGWTLGFSAPFRSADQVWSFVTANRTSGMLRSSVNLYLGREPHFRISEMAFYGAAGEQAETNRHSPFGEQDRLISSRTLAFSGGDITCSDYAPSYPLEGDHREVSCVTPSGDLSCFVNGDDEDVTQFYQALRSIRPSH